jgi:hypothetical protein
MPGFQQHRVDQRLSAMNPVPTRAAAVDELDTRAREDLDRILNTTAVDGPSHGRRWRRAGAAAALVGLTTAVVIAGPMLLRGGGTAYAATPPLLKFEKSDPGIDPTKLLTQIAERTQSLPDDVGAGRYAYVHTRSWDLFVQINEHNTTSEVVPQERHQWLANDGTGRTLVSMSFSNGKQLRRDRAASGDPADLMWPLRSLSANEDVLAAQLMRGHPAVNGPAERFEAIKDAYLQMPLSPTVRSAVLRYLADTPGVSVTGPVTDRAGREGIGFSLESDYTGLPTQYTLIIDPTDGRLLSSESILTTTAGALNVPVPSVIGYTVFVRSTYTPRAILVN